MALPVLHSLLLWYTADAVECHGNVLGKLPPSNSRKAAATHIVTRRVAPILPSPCHRHGETGYSCLQKSLFFIDLPSEKS